MAPSELAEPPVHEADADSVDWLDRDNGVRMPPRGEDLPYDDGEPLESTWHRDAMNMLIENIKWWWRDRTDYFVGGNMFVYFSERRVFNKDFRGPDVFVSLGVTHNPLRKSWVTWEEDGHQPDLIVEMISESTRDLDFGLKKELYARVLRTSEYYCVDPELNHIDGWKLVEREYQPITPVDGLYPSEVLGASIGWCNIAYHDPKYPRPHPRLFDANGKLIPIFAEAEKARADEAEAELARLRAELATRS